LLKARGIKALGLKSAAIVVDVREQKSLQAVVVTVGSRFN
jgi:hypothetical protein